MDTLTPARIDVIARACHEVNRAWCLALGDTSQVGWDDAPEWQRVSAREGIAVAAAGATPEAQHAAWMDAKLRDGWTYGAVKDPARKLHPCIVDYAELPGEQRSKDAMFVAVVGSFLAAFRSFDTFNAP